MRRYYGIDASNPNDVHSLRDRVEAWRNGESGNDLEACVLSAMRGGDAEFVEAVAKAMRPEPLKLTAATAVMSAFFTIFVTECQCRSWPTKKQVKELATRILQRGGHPIPGKRYWAQIFEQTGLSGLPEAPRGRPKK